MQKFLLPIAASLLLASTCYANDTQSEVIDSLGTAQKLVKDGSYAKAIEEVNYALAKINELTAESVVKYIPEAPPEFTLVNKSSQGVGTGMAFAGSAGANAQYTSDAGASLDLNIAIGGVSGQVGSLAGLATMFAGMSQDPSMGETRQVRINGYTGTQIFNAAQRSGSLTFQVGPKITVSIEGESVDSVDAMKALAKNMDFAGLEKSF